MQKIDKLSIFIIAWFVVIGTMAMLLFWRADVSIQRIMTGIINSVIFIVIGVLFYSGHYANNARKDRSGWARKYDHKRLSKPLGYLFFLFSIFVCFAFMSLEFNQNVALYVFVFGMIILLIGILYFALGGKYRSDVC